MISSIIVWILESSIGRALIKLVWDELSAKLEALVAKHKAILANQAAADASIAPLQKATTAKEIDDASTDALGGF